MFQDLDLIMVKEARFLSHFRVIFSEAAGVVAKISLSLKPNHQLKISLSKSLYTLLKVIFGKKQENLKKGLMKVLLKPMFINKCT